MKQRPVCDKCGTIIPHNSNFCPACGDPVTEEDFLGIIPENIRPQIEISFGFSHSSLYKDAVNFASRFPTYRSEGEGKEIKHYVSFDLEDIEAAISLWDMISKWKSSKMSLGGEMITKKNLIYGPLGCWRERKKSPLPEAYCYGTDRNTMEQNIWGCFRLGISNYQLFSTWGGFSELVENRYLIINKEELGKKLAISYLQNRICPALDRERISKVFSSIPKKIDLLNYTGPLEAFLSDAKTMAMSATEREKFLKEFTSNKDHTDYTKNTEHVEIYIKRREEKENNSNLRKLIKWVGVLLLILFLLYFISK